MLTALPATNHHSPHARRYYHPANTTISIVGDVKPEGVRRLAEKYFGGWKAAEGAVTLPVGRQESAAEARPQVGSLESVNVHTAVGCAGCMHGKVLSDNIDTQGSLLNSTKVR